MWVKFRSAGSESQIKAQKAPRFLVRPFYLRVYLAAIVEISNSSLMFSETRIPPVSRTAFHVRPKSLRLISATPSKPKRALPNGSVAVPEYSKSIVIGFVTSLIVRLPSTASLSEPESLIDVEAKVIFGKLATSKKSAD